MIANTGHRGLALTPNDRAIVLTAAGGGAVPARPARRGAEIRGPAWSPRDRSHADQHRRRPRLPATARPPRGSAGCRGQRSGGSCRNGLASWTLGCIPYFPSSPPAATPEPGRLVADRLPAGLPLLVPRPSGCCASRRWTSRGGAASRPRDRAAVFAMLFVVVGTLVLEPLDRGENIAQLVPVTLDLLLLAALYNAVRRSTVTHRDGLRLVRYAFAALAVTDGAGDASCVTRGARAPPSRRRSSATCVAHGAGALRRAASAAGDRDPDRARALEDDPRRDRPRA